MCFISLGIGILDIVLSERYKLLLGDFREVGKEIPDNSIDMIFTDPPYGTKTLDIFKYLAYFASTKLKDGGRLVTYTNTTQIPNIITYLDSTLKYISIIGVEQQKLAIPMLWGSNIMCYLKFLLFYVKGKYKPTNTIVNLIASRFQGKKYHGWQQSTLEATYLITYLTQENQTVVDPMMGSGTTGIAALNINRKFIGIEKEEATYHIAENRIKNSINYQLSKWQ